MWKCKGRGGDIIEHIAGKRWRRWFLGGRGRSNEMMDLGVLGV